MTISEGCSNSPVFNDICTRSHIYKSDHQSALLDRPERFHCDSTLGAIAEISKWTMNVVIYVKSELHLLYSQRKFRI
jgi:hypothetical protein